MKKIRQFIDYITLHRVWGIITFFIVMFLIFEITFLFGNVISNWIDTYIVQNFADFVTAVFQSLGVSQRFTDFLVHGVIMGIGSIFIFLPQITIAYALLTLIDQVGYTRRVSHSFSFLLKRFNIQADSVIPLLLGFGCNVPALIAAKNIGDRQQYILTLLAIPFISCIARFQIYIVFTAAFFSENEAIVLLSIYIIGIVVAFLTFLILSPFVKHEKINKSKLDSSTIDNSWRAVNWKWWWYGIQARVKKFLFMTGTVIAIGSGIIWVLYTNGILDKIGILIAPIFTPLGFGFAIAAIAIIIGFFRKELVIAFLAIALGTTADGLVTTLPLYITPIIAYSFLLFNSLYVPCFTTIATIYTESKSLWYSSLSIIYSLLVAYIVSFAFFQIASLFI